MITNLANKLFNHSFTTIGNISPNHINCANAVYKIIDTNFFVYNATNWYLSDKSYRIIIDIGEFKHFTLSYGQFMAYISNIKYTIIDIYQAGAIYI